MLPPNSIRAILFDLDGTLRHHLPSGSEEFNRYVRALGISIQPEDAIRAARWEHYYFAYSPELKADNETYTDGDQFWLNYGRRRLVALGCSSKQAEEIAPQVHVHMSQNHKTTVHVPEEARSLLPVLKEAGYILGVVSNREEPFERQIEEMELKEYFRFTLAGGQINSYKPEAEIFLAALERAGTSARQTMYVGDNYFADVVGARRAGLQPVLYDPGGLFPEAECPVIRSFDQLAALLK